MRPDVTRENWEYTQIGYFFAFHVTINYILKTFPGARWTGRLHKIVFMFWTMMVCFYMYRENRPFHHPGQADILFKLFVFFWLITDRVIHDEGMGVQIRKYFP